MPSRFSPFPRRVFFFAFALLFAIEARAQDALPAYFATYEKQCRELIANPGKLDGKTRLHGLFKDNWDYLMHDFPEWATDIGYPGLNHLWTDMSPAAVAKRKDVAKLTLEAISNIPRSELPESEALNYDIFRRTAELEAEKTRFPEEYLQVTQLDGAFQDSLQIIENMPTANAKDYENILSRLNALPALLDQATALLRRGLAEKITPPKITLRDVPKQVADQIVQDPWKSPALKPFTRFPAEIPEERRRVLREKAVAAYDEKLKPAFQKFRDFLESTYVPGARETIAFTEVPEGKTWYALKVRDKTTTTLTAEEIHQIGLNEVKRIRGEMGKIVTESRFQGTLADFFAHLRSDPKFFYAKRSQLLRGYRDIAKRVDPELVKLFGTLPRLPYGIKAVPRYAEKSQTTAYYWPGSLKAGRAGYFFANTYDLKSRPKWEMEALTLHEAVPGHHLQIAIARELEGMPEFRKEGDFTAFIEGWGLYSESLGAELGLYESPYSRFGKLTYEMWRAIRLVVDTGLHAKGWTREQAIDFFTENAGKASHDIEVEVDRYIVWPGQALAYKLGELKIKELRAFATAELGDKFDVREFHDEVLGQGALPLDFLEKRIRDWVNRRKSGTAAFY